MEVGDTVKDFTLTSHAGTEVNLAEQLKKHRSVVLAFYLLDFTGDEQKG